MLIRFAVVSSDCLVWPRGTLGTWVSNGLGGSPLTTPGPDVEEWVGVSHRGVPPLEWASVYNYVGC